VKFFNAIVIFFLIIIAQSIQANESVSYQERFNGTYQLVDINGIYFNHIDYIPKDLRNYCSDTIQITNNVNPEGKNEIYIYDYNYFYNKYLRSDSSPKLLVKKSQNLSFFFRTDMYEHGKRPDDLDGLSGFYDTNDTEGTCEDENNLAVCIVTNLTGFLHYKIKRKSTNKHLSYKFSTREFGVYQYARVKKKKNGISLKRKGLTRSSGGKFRNRKTSKWNFTCDYVPVN